MGDSDLDRHACRSLVGATNRPTPSGPRGSPTGQAARHQPRQPRPGHGGAGPSAGHEEPECPQCAIRLASKVQVMSMSGSTYNGGTAVPS